MKTRAVPAPATGPVGSRPPFWLSTVLSWWVSSVRDILATTTFSDAPLAKFILPSACHWGSGSRCVADRVSVRVPLFGGQSPRVSWRGPDVTSHLAGKPGSTPFGQPGKITRRIERRRGRGGVLRRTSRQAT